MRLLGRRIDHYSRSGRKGLEIGHRVLDRRNSGSFDISRLLPRGSRIVSLNKAGHNGGLPQAGRK
jgi:hypothetical protein